MDEVSLQAVLLMNCAVLHLMTQKSTQTILLMLCGVKARKWALAPRRSLAVYHRGSKTPNAERSA